MKKALTVDDVRALALALPETTEKPCYGTPGFRVKDKLFARMKEDGESLVVFMTFDQREVVLASAPDVFFLTPHYENSEMVLVHLKTVGKRLLADLLREAWLLRAPAKLRSAIAPHPRSS